METSRVQCSSDCTYEFPEISIAHCYSLGQRNWFRVSSLFSETHFDKREIVPLVSACLWSSRVYVVRTNSTGPRHGPVQPWSSETCKIPTSISFSSFCLESWILPYPHCILLFLEILQVKPLLLVLWNQFYFVWRRRHSLCNQEETAPFCILNNMRHLVTFSLLFPFL